MAIKVVAGADPDATRVLIANMTIWIDRCAWCTHFARPGLSDGYCTGRDDLPEVDGQMHSLPAHLGAGCGVFESVVQSNWANSIMGPAAIDHCKPTDELVPAHGQCLRGRAICTTICWRARVQDAKTEAAGGFR